PYDRRRHPAGSNAAVYAVYPGQGYSAGRPRVADAASGRAQGDYLRKSARSAIRISAGQAVRRGLCEDQAGVAKRAGGGGGGNRKFAAQACRRCEQEGAAMKALAALFAISLPLLAVDGVVVNVTTGKPQSGVAINLVQPSQNGMV